jgi:Ca2+-binding EF-hand superfamily protein
MIVFNRELGENMTDEELRAMIDEFDRDGDGESKILSFRLNDNFYLLLLYNII